jgi:hypothetical protein
MERKRPAEREIVRRDDDRCELSRVYGTAAYAKRRKRESPYGIWYAVMFARKDDTMITCTSHVASLFLSSDRELTTTTTATAPREQRWTIMVALGPLREENDANSICRVWTLNDRALMHRVARAEGIAIRFGIRGFVDWDMLFGATGVPYRLEYHKNPCQGEGGGGGRKGRKKGTDAEKK